MFVHVLLFFLLSLGLSGTAQSSRQANDVGNNASDEHPDSFVSRRAGEEFGDIGREGVCGVDAIDDEHHSTDEQCHGNEFIHKMLSIDLLICVVAD
jgi:hypothetical protein